MGVEMAYCVFNFANSRVAETQHEVICTLAYQANYLTYGNWVLLLRRSRLSLANIIIGLQVIFTVLLTTEHPLCSNS